MDMQELHNYRVNLFRDASKFTKPDRLPINGNIWSWMFIDAGYTIEESVHDYEKIKKATERIAETYAIDSLGGDGLRNPTLITDAAGGSPQFNIEGNKVCVTDCVCMQPEDFDAFTNDYMKALYEIAFFNKYPKAREMTAQQLAEAAKSVVEFNETWFTNYMTLNEKYGLADVTDSAWYLDFAFDKLFNTFRGIKDTSIDIRRYPEKVKAFTETIDAQNFEAPLADIKSSPYGPDMTRAFDIFTAFLGHTILTPKKFEIFFWPYMKKMFDTAEEMGKSVLIVAEGTWKHLIDFFNDYKKGTLSIFAEDDNIFEMRKLCPNIALLGGLHVDVMGKGTPEQCVDMTKRLYNELGGDGGLILSPNKMVSFPYDMKPENLKAVCDYNVQVKLK